MRRVDNNRQEEREKGLSLSELLGAVSDSLRQAFPETYWIRAETVDVRVNYASGHCYLEFIEKEQETGQTVARVRGSIWAKTFRLLKPYFEMETGRTFVSGLKVLVKVSVEFHPLYGFSLNVLDIDPTYTVGDLLRRRREIIRQLEEEGIFTLNKELPMPALPQRIAVVTSPTAAGYEDFLDQLRNNRQGFPFYLHLFPATMQGEKTEASVIAALDRIDAHRDLFDVVVIIRGGGATSDLNSFDSYLLAANCAQFPLPVITGIGHERDDTIVDLVAHTRLKTPTAVAEYLIGLMEKQAGLLDTLQAQCRQSALQRLTEQKSFLQLLVARFPSLVTGRIGRSRTSLQALSGRLPVALAGCTQRQRAALAAWTERLRHGASARLASARGQLEMQEQYIRLASPEQILKRGYSLTLREGKIIKRASELRQGDKLTTRFMDGEVESERI